MSYHGDRCTPGSGPFSSPLFLFLNCSWLKVDEFRVGRSRTE